MCCALCDCAFRIGVAPARQCVNAASILGSFLKIQYSLQKRCEDASHSNSETVRESSTACKIQHAIDSVLRKLWECGPSSGRFLLTKTRKALTPQLMVW